MTANVPPTAADAAAEDSAASVREAASADASRNIPPRLRRISRLFRGLKNVVRRNRFDESIVATVLGHFEILALMRHPYLKPLQRKDPYAQFRPYRTYLAPTFSRPQRRELFREHYLHLTSYLRESFFRRPSSVRQCCGNIWWMEDA